MNHQEILTNLCVHDKRNPDCVDDPEEQKLRYVTFDKDKEKTKKCLLL